MECRRILPVRPSTPQVRTLNEFRKIFFLALNKYRIKRDSGDSKPEERRGDHDLNPGMELPTNQRPASVLIPIIERSEHLTILLTERSPNLPHHPGQVSFPGGRFEESDVDMIDTALREAEEEIGLDRKRVEVIGRLDTYVTRTGFVVTPIVGLVYPPFEIKPDPVEVADVFEVPLAFVLDRANHERHSREWENRKRHFYVFPHPERYIWGATAGMLVNLAEMLLGVLESRGAGDERN